MHDLSTMLRESRERLGLTHEELNQRTKIRIRYIKAIEDGEFGIIPGEVYLKGFVRSIARELDLDYDDLMEHYYQKEAEEEEKTTHQRQKKEKQVVMPNQRKRRSNIAVSRPPRSRRWLLLLLIALVALGAVYYVYFYQNQATPISPPNEPGQDLPPVVDPIPQEPPQDLPPDEPQLPVVQLLTEESTEILRIYEVRAEEISMVLSVPSNAGSSCWIGIREVDSNVEWAQAESYTIRAGSSQALFYEVGVEVRVGNPVVARLTVNGVELFPGMYDGAPVTRVVTYRFLLIG